MEPDRGGAWKTSVPFKGTHLATPRVFHQTGPGEVLAHSSALPAELEDGGVTSQGVPDMRHPVLGEVSPIKIDYRRKGALYWRT